jgi:hypothetical protein
MPYSVPRRRGNISLAAIGSSDSEAPTHEQTAAPLRLLNSLPTNVIIHSPSPNKQQRAKAQSQPNHLNNDLSPPQSHFGLPTPPQSHNDILEIRRSETPDITSKRQSPHVKMTPRSNKRTHESPGDNISTASKRRAVQGATPRSVISGSRYGDQSPSQGRNSPTKTLVNKLLRQSFPSHRPGHDEQDMSSRDRILLLPTRRSREQSRAQMMENADTTTFESDLPEASRRVLFEKELQTQEQREKENERLKQLEMLLSDDYTNLLHGQDQGYSPQKYAGLESEDILPPHRQDASSPSAHLSTPLVKAASPMKKSAVFQSSPRPSSPAILNSTPNDIPLSPLQSRERLGSNQQPMESTPFPLGKKKVGGRKSTPHPGQEGKVRASLAALASPRRAQRVPRDDEDITLERGLSPTPGQLLHYSREVSMELDYSHNSSMRPPERELSTILAIEQDDDSDEVDDLSHFTVEASRTRRNSSPKKATEYDEDVGASASRRLANLTKEVPDDTEEILADDFVYETVVVEETEQQVPSIGQHESTESSRDSSPIIMDVQYNPEGDMNLNMAEVQQRKQQIEDEERTQRYLMSREYGKASRIEAVHAEKEESNYTEEAISANEAEGEGLEEDHLENGDEGEDSAERRRYLELEEEEFSVEESADEDVAEQTDEDEEVVDEVIIEDVRDDESMEDDVSTEESEGEEEEGVPDHASLEELEADGGHEQVAEESESEEEVDMQDEEAGQSSEEEVDSRSEDEAEASLDDRAGHASEIHVRIDDRSVHQSQVEVADRSGNASRFARMNSMHMDSTINNSLWRSFTERTKLLTARPGAVEVSSMNRENAARATAILTLFHKYVQYGVLDVEIDDEDIEASMHHHALEKEASTLRQLLLQHDAIEADKTLDQVLAEKQSEIKKTGIDGRLKVPSTPLLTPMAAASPKTPLLPGAFPPSSSKSRSAAKELHLSPEKIADKSFRYCQPSQVNLAVFSKQNWQALESVVRSEITASARALLAKSKLKHEEALLQAAMELKQEDLARAFLDAYKVPTSDQRKTKEWSTGKVQSKVASLIRTYLISLQEKHPDLGIDADVLTDATLSRVDLSLIKGKQVDESGVAETTLRLPFRLVTQSTPAPLSKATSAQHESLDSPCLDKGDRSDGFNIYPRLPKPLIPFNAEWKSSEAHKAPTKDLSQERRQDQSVEKSGDVSSGLTGLASRSLGFVYASMGWNKRPVIEVKEKAVEIMKKPRDSQPAHSSTHMPRSTLPSSSSFVDHSSLSYNRFQSQMSYGNGSSRLIRSGVSSSVDPTALALLSPHTHQLAKAKVQQFKESRREKNWRSPRHDRLSDASSFSMSRLR